MRTFCVVVGLIAFSVTLPAKPVPLSNEYGYQATAEYWERYLSLSASRKQEEHYLSAQATRRRAIPSRLQELCATSIAGLSLVSKAYLQQFLETEPPSTVFSTTRALFGKPIHHYGVTAKALITLEAGSGLLGARGVPATIRFSSASPHFPWVERLAQSGVFNYHPGFMISFHIDGQSDRSLYLMPSDGLDGSYDANPFDLPYTHRLEYPALWGMRLAAAVSLSRVTLDPTQQSLAPFSLMTPEGKLVSFRDQKTPHQLQFIVVSEAKARYQSGLKSAKPWRDDPREILMDWGREELPYTLFEVVGSDGTSVGHVEIISEWIASKWGDLVPAMHPGFVSK